MRFSKAHVIGKYASQSIPVEVEQPGQAVALILAQMIRNNRKIIMILPFFHFQQFFKCGSFIL